MQYVTKTIHRTLLATGDEIKCSFLNLKNQMVIMKIKYEIGVMTYGKNRITILTHFHAAIL
jgi:hypothetical protein